MNKYIKYILIFLGAVLILIAIIVGLFFWSISSNRDRATKDGVELSATCDTVKYVTEQPEITLIDFKKKDVSTVKFQILRDKKFLNDTLVKGKFHSTGGAAFIIPYPKFLKTDTIVITTTNKLKYFISGYHHFASLHFGMTGYVGGGDCRFTNDCTINNVQSHGVISKIDGWIDPAQMKNRRIIAPITDEYQILSQKSPINEQKANDIFIINRKNKHLYSLFTYGIEVSGKGSFYTFGEQIENKENQIDIIKINTITGEYKRYTNYPFDN